MTDLTETPVPTVKSVAELLDLKVSKKSNGADYDITFEVPIHTMAELAEGGDGHELTFRNVLVGSGALVRRSGITRDADGMKRARIVVRLSQMDIGRSGGVLLNMIADSETRGDITFEPSQITMNELLTKRADDGQEELLPE